MHRWTDDIARTALGVLALAALLCSAPGWASSRVALVVGNGAYAAGNLPALANPVNDATLMAKALEAGGFEVALVTDADQGAMKAAIEAFGKQLKEAGDAVGLFYYAGHGVEVRGHNYLIPVGADIEHEVEFKTDAVPADWVLSWMGAAGNRLNMVVLDACRNNPYEGRYRGASQGLAQMDAPSGTLIAYSAAPGQVALDGAGENSPYTAALAQAVVEPGLRVEDVFKRVRVAVGTETNGEQTPWESSSLTGDFYFVAKPAEDTPTPVPAPETVTAELTVQQLAARAYEAAERIHTVSSYRLVIERFPGTLYAELARQQIEKLEGATPAPAVSAEEVESSLGLARSKRRMVQHGLASLDYAPGPADGLFGKRTREAIRRYQGAKGLETTGYLTAEQSQALVALGAEAVRADDTAYAAAKSAGTVEAYASYLDSYPSGQYVAEVRRLRAEAQRVERTRREQAPGRRFRDCPQCPEMVVVPAGSYMMGSPTGEEGRYDDESPVHRVRIANPFAVGVHEVTRGEFARFVRETGHSMEERCTTYEGGEWKERTGRSWRRPGFGQTDGHPVVCVDWNDAQSYVRWLSRETGERYRLLSESEWEYVARAGTRTSRHWGDRASDACRYANVADRSADEKYTNRTIIHECRDGHVYTAAVGSFSANPYGLHDALGNVSEWVADCWNDSYTGAPGDGRAWTRGDCDRRVVRGGTWLGIPRFVRSADRRWDDTGYRSNLAGFRVARTLN